jgi:hypothetical protein
MSATDFTQFAFDLRKNLGIRGFYAKTVFPSRKYSGTLWQGIGVDSGSCRICQLRK